MNNSTQDLHSHGGGTSAYSKCVDKMRSRGLCMDTSRPLPFLIQPAHTHELAPGLRQTVQGRWRNGKLPGVVRMCHVWAAASQPP